LRLLDKAVQHHDPLPDQRAEEDARDPVFALQPQFKQPTSQCLRMRLPQIWAQRDHAASQDDVPGSQRIWKGQDLLFDGNAVVADRIFHGATITYLL